MAYPILARLLLFLSRQRARTKLSAAALLYPPSAFALAAAATASPIVCTTTLEASVAGIDGSVKTGSPLVEVTRCGPITTQPDIVQSRFYSYSSPYARSIDLTHQLTDLFGIAMGGGDGTKVMGFGYIDQTITWDGSAVENTANVMLQNQYGLMPLRTVDVPTIYVESSGDQPPSSTNPYDSRQANTESWRPVVRGLW